MTRIWGAVASAVLTAAVLCPCDAQTLSPLSAFSRLSAAQLDGTQIRLTYVTPQLGGYPSVGFTTTGRTLDLSAFAPCYRLSAGFSYNGDAVARADFTVSSVELERMIDSVGTIAAVAAGGVDSSGFLSFGLLVVVDGKTRCFEAIVGEDVGTTLMTKILHALAGNAAAVEGISSFACSLGLLEGPPPHIVDDRVEVSLEDFQRIEGTTQFVGRLRLRNKSSEPLNTPLAVALAMNYDVRLLSATGHTCMIAPGRMGYMRFAATRPVAPGAMIEMDVRLDNPGLEPLQARFVRVFIDSGGR